MRSLKSTSRQKLRFQESEWGKSQEIETLINEEALLFAQYLRNEKHVSNPRVVNLNYPAL